VGGRCTHVWDCIQKLTSPNYISGVSESVGTGVWKLAWKDRQLREDQRRTSVELQRASTRERWSQVSGERGNTNSYLRLRAIQIIRDTFLAYFRPSPRVWRASPLVFQKSTHCITFKKAGKYTKIWFKILVKMSRDTLANPLPPSCGIWWHSPVHPPTRVSRII